MKDNVRTGIGFGHTSFWTGFAIRSPSDILNIDAV